MENILSLVALGVMLGLTYYLYKLKNPGATSEQKVSPTVGERSNEQMQQDYAQNKQKLSLITNVKDKVEESWKFLYQITEIVWSRFSEVDREQVHAIGKALKEYGMKYNHVVEYGIQQEHKKQQEMAREDKPKDGSNTLGV